MMPPIIINNKPELLYRCGTHFSFSTSKQGSLKSGVAIAPQRGQACIDKIPRVYLFHNSGGDRLYRQPQAIESTGTFHWYGIRNLVQTCLCQDLHS